MPQQRVLLGELVIDREPPIELHVELPCSEAAKKSAALKDRLAFLLDTRFRPADPEPHQKSTLTVAEVADLFRCRCVTVLRMVKRGKLHPVSDQDGDLRFDPAEVDGIRHVPLGSMVSRLIKRD